MYQTIYNLFEALWCSRLHQIDEQAYGSFLLLSGLLVGGVICGAQRYVERCHLRFFSKY